jgi:hypothetical protein
MMKRTWTALLILPAAMCLAGAAQQEEVLQSLSGTIGEAGKSEIKYELDLDGATGRMAVTGDVLDGYEPGDHIFVRGIIKTRLHNPEPDGTPQQQPAHWVIVMEVREARAIKTPFGLNG